MVEGLDRLEPHQEPAAERLGGLLELVELRPVIGIKDAPHLHLAPAEPVGERDLAASYPSPRRIDRRLGREPCRQADRCLSVSRRFGLGQVGPSLIRPRTAAASASRISRNAAERSGPAAIASGIAGE